MSELPRVLVVDDDHDIREAISGILIDDGCEVSLASNGAEALQVLASVIPRLILLDLNMPVMSGLAFRRAQLADPRLARIPTVVMTAVDRYREQIASLAVDRALAKPIGLDDLMAVVAQYAHGRQVAPV